MKTILSFILSLFLFISAGAQTTDYLTNKDFQAEKKKLNEGINTAKKSSLEAKKGLEMKGQLIDSLAGALKLSQVQLAASNDSISKLTAKVNELQDKVYQKKTGLRTSLIIAFAVIFLLWILLLIWIFVIKKRSDQTFQLLKAEIEGQHNNRV